MYINRFYSSEIEYSLVKYLISEGDWVIDVGANIGHYTIRFSELVGPTGRVLAFEPVPDTFNLLSSICRYSGYSNISLFNIAVSNNSVIHSMMIPRYRDGVKNYYRAQIINQDGDVDVLSVALDKVKFPQKISFIKIDAEGHDYNVLLGLSGIIKADFPLIMLEECNTDIITMLAEYNYRYIKLGNSHNTIFYPESMRDKIEQLKSKSVKSI